MAYPTFQVFTFGPASSGANSSNVLCNPGDALFLTGTMRYVSGVIVPNMYVQFYTYQNVLLATNIVSIPTVADTGWHFVQMSCTAPANAAYFVAGTAVPSGFGQWQISDYRVMQNGSPASAGLTEFSGTYSVSSQFVFPLYYLSLLTSHTKMAPKWYAWCAALLTPMTDMLATLKTAEQQYALPPVAQELAFTYQASGVQLDYIGKIVGVSRTLPFTPSIGAVSATTTEAIIPGTLVPVTVSNTTNMVVGLSVTVDTGANAESTLINYVGPGNQITATFYKSHASGVAVTASGTALSPVLSDADYRTLLLAKIGQNQWNGQIDSLYALWSVLFPGGKLIFIDNQNMTATIIIGGTFTPMQEQMIVNGLIIPRPQGVQYQFGYPSDLPLFGFDLNNSQIAGWDTGHWS